MIKTVFFDLDGTLLPMDQEIFVKDYLGRLAKYMAAYGYDPKALSTAVLEGVGVMVKNDGSKTNEKAFWDLFSDKFGENVMDDVSKFEEFYRTEFQKCSASCGFKLEAKETIDHIKNLGFKVVLATNPLFPQIATHSRAKWAGLNIEDFEFITTYDNSSYCKPNPLYYKELLKKLGLKAEECLMVGNDSIEDTVAAELGMKIFLLTDCLIDKGNDISAFQQGSFKELKEYVSSLK